MCDDLRNGPMLWVGKQDCAGIIKQRGNVREADPHNADGGYTHPTGHSYAYPAGSEALALSA